MFLWAFKQCWQGWIGFQSYIRCACNLVHAKKATEVYAGRLIFDIARLLDISGLQSCGPHCIDPKTQMMLLSSRLFETCKISYGIITSHYHVAYVTSSCCMVLLFVELRLGNSSKIRGWRGRERPCARVWDSTHSHTLREGLQNIGKRNNCLMTGKTWGLRVPLNTLCLASGQSSPSDRPAATYTEQHSAETCILCAILYSFKMLHFQLTQTCPSHMQCCSETSLEANHFYCDCAIMRDEDFHTEVSEVSDFERFFNVLLVLLYPQNRKHFQQTPRNFRTLKMFSSCYMIDLRINLHIEYIS